MAGKKVKDHPPLKPCPFCGSVDIHVKQGATLIVDCQECGAVMFNYQNGVQRDVYKAWNSRVEVK